MGDENKEEITPRSADFFGETQRYPMDGNSNCTAWCRWETYRVYRDGQPGWDCRFIINATKTNSYPTYGQGSLQAGVKGHEEGTLEEKYIEIVAGETRTFYDQAVFVRAENENDIQLTAYANLLIPNVVSKGMEFLITVKRNLWYVTYNANGGIGAPGKQKKHFNNTLYLTTQKPTKSGYTFKGWSASSSSSYAQYQPGDAFTTDTDTTLYAVWGQNVANTWSITYNANGGSNAPAKQTANVGQSITITSSKPTRTGYSFLGWSTWSGSTYPEYYPGDSVRSSSNMTLYAIWEQNQSTQYSLSFNLQGGTGTFNTLYGDYGDSVQIPYNSPTRSGYSFLGWATSSYGSAAYQPGEYFTLYRNSTLYAVWEIQGGGGSGDFKLEFDLQGGTGSFPAMYGNSGSRVQIPNREPTKQNADFLGWSDSPGGNVYYYPGDYYTLYTNGILYAIWDEALPSYCTIYFDANSSGDYVSNIPSNYTAYYGQTVNISNKIPVRSGYTFKGWALTPDGGAVHQPGDAFTAYADTTLYAVWQKQEEDRYTISFDLQGGSGEFNPLKGKYGEAWYLPSYSPVKDGYVFKGWATSPGGNPEYQPDDVYTIYGNATLYAVWEEDKRMYLGYDRIRKIYIGNKQVTAAYLGTAKIW
mgnify:CR=1 FL=1